MALRNWCNFRNATMNNQPCLQDNENLDELPRVGVLEFDYVCTTRPGPQAVPVTDQQFQEIMLHLGVSGGLRTGSCRLVGRHADCGPLASFGTTTQAVVSKKVWKALGLFSIGELTLAVTKDYFSVTQVIALLECLPEGMIQPLVVSQLSEAGSGITVDKGP